MDDVIPKPLRIVKSPTSVNCGTNSKCIPTSYPRIPTRRSSRRDSRVCSVASATSTSTPPMDIDMDRLEVRKIRETEMRSPRTSISYSRNSQILSSSASGNMDEVVTLPSSSDTLINTRPQVATRGPYSNNDYVIRSKSGRKSRFLRAFESKSRKSSSADPSMRVRRVSASGLGPISYPITPITAQGLATASRGCSGGMAEPARPSTMPQLSGSIGRADYGIMTPFNVPIAGVKMEAAAETRKIGTDPISIWTTVDVAVDVKMEEPISPELALPLDVVLLLDNL